MMFTSEIETGEADDEVDIWTIEVHRIAGKFDQMMEKIWKLAKLVTKKRLVRPWRRPP